MDRRRFLFIASPVILGGLAWWSFAPRGGGDGAAPTSGGEGKPLPPGGLSQDEIRNQFDALEKDKQAYAAELSRKDLERQNRANAAAQTVKYREALQSLKSAPWSQYIAAHLREYQSLRAKAAASPDGRTACTICDGKGKTDFCVLCGSTGKCPTCDGSGRLLGGDFCPTCQGNGNCYLCKGFKKMACAFCDDGVIDIKAPPPPNQMPI